MDNNFMGDPFGSAPADSANILPSAFGEGGNQTPPSGSNKKRGLHWIQALLVLIVTTGASFLLSLLLNVEYSANPFLEPALVLKNGLFFALLAAAILITAFLIEVATSAMTPRFSRKLQIAVALIAIILCGLIGALGELVFVNSYVRPQIEPPPTATPDPALADAATAEQAPKAYIIAMDKSGSMNGTRNISAVQAVSDLLPMLPEDVQVGFIAFTDEIAGEVPLATNNSTQRSRIISSARNLPASGGTTFSKVLDKALEMVRSSRVSGPTRLIFITDGSGGSVDSYVSNCQSLSIEVSAIMLGSVTSNLKTLVDETGGSFTTVTDMRDLVSVAQTVALATPKPGRVTPTEVPQVKNMAYALDDAAYYLLVILVLVGVVIGVALTLMLSLSNQFRIQLILSPLMGVCAYLLILFKVVPLDLIWIAYALFGVVLMRRNDGYSDYPGKMPPNRAQTSGLDIESLPQSTNNNGSFGSDPFGSFNGNDSLF